jgi:hypothetical protein
MGGSLKCATAILLGLIIQKKVCSAKEINGRANLMLISCNKLIIKEHYLTT